ncbi:hypothetical protein Goarm_011083, partial [Gossypium armourianum]|nr:hypothetical protein [Gossypium armourianum]
TIPADIWPPGDVLAPWDIKIEPPTPYQEQLKKALEEYRNAIQNKPAWTNSQEKTSLMDEEDNFYNSSDGLEQQIEQTEIKCYRVKEEKAKMIEELNVTSDVNIDYESD